METGGVSDVEMKSSDSLPKTSTNVTWWDEPTQKFFVSYCHAFDHYWVKEREGVWFCRECRYGTRLKEMTDSYPFPEMVQLILNMYGAKVDIKSWDDIRSLPLLHYTRWGYGTTSFTQFLNSGQINSPLIQRYIRYFEPMWI